MYSVRYEVQLRWMVNYLLKVYKANIDTKPANRRELFDTFSTYTELSFKIGLFLYFLSILSYFVYPIYMYVFESKIVTIIPSYIPGVNENTYGGYAVLSIYHIVLLVLALFGTTASDFLYVMLIINTPVLAVLLSYEVTELNHILTQKKIDENDMKHRVQNIILMHREITM